MNDIIYLLNQLKKKKNHSRVLVIMPPDIAGRFSPYLELLRIAGDYIFLDFRAFQKIRRGYGNRDLLNHVCQNCHIWGTFND